MAAHVHEIARTRLFLVRHGHTIWNDEDRMRGRKDVGLSERGQAQARAVGELLADYPVSCVYSGPLQRTVITAEQIAIHHRLEPITSEGFNDFDFGEWQGLLRTEIKQRWAELYAVYDSQPARFQAPGGETLAFLQERVWTEFERVRSVHTGQTVVIVSHSVTLQMLILAILGSGPEHYWHIKQGPCCLNEVEHGYRGYALVRLNDTHHIAQQ
ncbi:histidine phosphatase family protein [bacterium]|nr:histidine phosphatase family protein [bacterium]